MNFLAAVLSILPFCQRFVSLVSTQISEHGYQQKFLQGCGNVDILLIILKLLTMQCKYTLTKHITISTPQR